MYQSAKFDVQMFDIEDVITTSGTSPVPPVVVPPPPPPPPPPPGPEPKYIGED